jgi:glutathione S-transferase
MKLFEFPPTRSIRVRWTLQELAVDFESVTVDLRRNEQHHPDFLKLNPAGRVPVLVDGGLVLTESVAIVMYLAEKYADRGFTPVELRERARMQQWMLFAATELEQPLWRIARHTNVYPADRRLPGEVALAREDFAAMAAVLDEHMQERRYVVANAVSVADFVLGYTLDWADEVGLLCDFPRLRAYMERLYMRPHAPPRIAQALAGLGL